MTEHQKYEAAQKILGEMKDQGLKLQDIDQEQKAHSALWEVAVKKGDGIAEAAERDALHRLLDQSYDIRHTTLQLAKKFYAI